MFSGIFGGLTTEPKQSSLITKSNLIAEPAQVMVMVPGTRTAQAEGKLAALRSFIFGFVILFVVAIVSIVCYYLFKNKKYDGRELPGAIKSLKIPEVKSKPKISEEEKIIEPRISSMPSLSSTIASEDIVQVYGTLPIWSTNEQVSEVEPKVSENNNEINKLIKSREDLTQHFEALTKLK